MNPADPRKNMHHTETYRSEKEWWEDNFGKGPYDPDFIGYPGERPTATHDYPLNKEPF